MVLIRLDPNKTDWTEITKEDKQKLTEEEQKEIIYLDKNLKDKIDYGIYQQKKAYDFILQVDGVEGCGKSTLGLTIAWYITKAKLTMDNLAENNEDAIQKLRQLPDESLLLIDEGSLSFSSVDVMTKSQKQLTKIINVIRQKRMCLIIVAPSFFNLSKYISVERSVFLLHVYSRNGERGFFSYYGSKLKRQLYSIGKNNFNSYAFPSPKFRGRFTDFQLPFNDEYLEFKRKSLDSAFDGKTDKKYCNEADIVGKLVREMHLRKPELTQRELAEIFNRTDRQIRNYLVSKTS